MKKIIDPSLVLIFLSHSTNFAIFSNQSFMKFNGMASFFKYKNKNTESNKKKTKQKKNKDVYSCQNFESKRKMIINKSIKGCRELSGKILRSLAKFLIPSILQSPFLKDFIIYPDVIFWDTLKRTKNCLTLGKIRGEKGYIAKSVHSDGYFLKSEHFVKEFSLIFFLS